MNRSFSVPRLSLEDPGWRAMALPPPHRLPRLDLQVSEATGEATIEVEPRQAATSAEHGNGDVDEDMSP